MPLARTPLLSRSSHRPTVAVADAHPQNARLLVRALERAGIGKVVAIAGGFDRICAGAGVPADLLILDLDLPTPEAGLELLARRPASRDPLAPVLATTSTRLESIRRRALAAGAHDLLTKPFDVAEAVLRVRNLLAAGDRYALARQRVDALEHLVRERTRELEATRLEMLARLCQAVEFRDDVTGRHTRRVGERSALLAGITGLPVEEVEIIRLAAPLHDVGKVAIPDAILQKEGPLTATEFAAMQRHTTIGARILAGGGTRLLETAETIARCHHERWDGTGYPEGLKGREIPVAARIVAIVDVFDAVTTNRPYRAAWETDRAREAIRAGAGTHFDPELVERFITLDLPGGEDETPGRLDE